MQAVDPHIRQVSELQQRMYEVVGSANMATGQNLAAFITDNNAISDLQGSIESFDNIVPPPLLAPLHRDIEKMLMLRLEAFKLTTAGREAELAKTPGNHYEKAEAKLEEANGITLSLNGRLQEVNLSVHAGRNQEQQASNP